MSITLNKPEPQSGYTPCACRDCMDVAMSSDVTKPELCEACKGADCRDWNSQVGQEHHSWFTCQRDDAYGEC